jgi:hypothetical protein
MTINGGTPLRAEGCSKAFALSNMRRIQFLICLIGLRPADAVFGGSGAYSR